MHACAAWHMPTPQCVHCTCIPTDSSPSAKARAKSRVGAEGSTEGKGNNPGAGADGLVYNTPPPSPSLPPAALILLPALWVARAPAAACAAALAGALVDAERRGEVQSKSPG
jgi:hypothetical protein